ncbi:MAG: hypothetical protein V4591_01185 [Bdellovibrionota bacterium]
MTRKIFILSLFFISALQANAVENKDNSVLIQGDQQVLEISDIPVPSYQYDDLSLFTKNFTPKKELIDLLNKPDVLMGLQDESMVLEDEEKL